MTEKIYLNLLFLCGILSPGIIGNVAHENIKEPSDILIRQKRVINCISGEDQRVSIDDVPYIVQIKQNMRAKCVGSILSRHVAITIAACLLAVISEYHVSSGSSYSDYGFTLHNVTDIKKHFGGHPLRPQDGIALLTVDPPFVYGRCTSLIQLHTGSLLAGTLGKVYGWGYIFRGEERGTQHPRNLRSIEVPILAHRNCVDIYRPRIEISEMDICTYHPQKHCGHVDGGAPLVVDGYLAGVHLWTGLRGGQYDPHYPDVFAILQHSAYNQWIRSNLRNIEDAHRQRS